MNEAKSSTGYVDIKETVRNIQSDIGTYYSYKDNLAYPEVLKVHLEVVLPKVESLNSQLNPELILSIHATTRHIRRAGQKPERIPTKVYKQVKKGGNYALHGYFSGFGTATAFYGRELVLVEEEFVLINKEQGLGVDADALITLIDTTNAPEHYLSELDQQLKLFGSIEKDQTLKIDGAWY